MWLLHKNLHFLTKICCRKEIRRQFGIVRLLWPGFQFNPSVNNVTELSFIAVSSRSVCMRTLDLAVKEDKHGPSAAEIELIEFLKSKPEISYKDDEILWERILLCKNSGISTETLRKYYSLLEYNQWELSSKLSILRSVGVNGTTVPLLLLTVNQLKRIRDIWNEDRLAGNENRLDLFRDLLQCDDEELGNLFLNHHLLLVMNFTRVYQICRLLKKHYIPPKNIKSDLWIFSHNIKEIEERLHMLSKAGIPDIHMWCLRCNQDTFVKYLQKAEHIQMIIKSHSSKLNYLSEQLKCDSEYIETELKRKLPQLLRVNILKLEKLFKILFSYSVTSEQILRDPRVLCMSAKTVESRLKELKEMKYELKTLSLLHTTHKKYSDFVRKQKKKDQLTGKER